MLPPAKTLRLSAPEPSVFKTDPKIPVFDFDASRITPPAPSPKMIHVSLSSKSSIDVIVSTPITIIVLYWPDSINFAPVSSAYKKPLQAALKSKAHAFSALILF